MSNDINNQGFTPEELELIAEQQDQMWEEQQEARYPSLLPTDGDQLFWTGRKSGTGNRTQKIRQTNEYVHQRIYESPYLLYQAAQAGAAEAEKRKSEFWPPTTAEHWLVYPM